ncbi:MAG TPA: ATP-dependent DNA ligase, partial [Actinomycetota bacterium]|nr:ATP-dependent DNA ligase [Actinomycetota bacterium]
MLFADLVACSGELAGTSSRSRKVAIIAELLRKLDPDEIPIAVSFLSGVPLQGRIGVGYAIAYGVEQPSAEEPSLTLADVDSAITKIQTSVGSGSGGDRKRILGAVFGRATEPEADFLRRLFTGELRQGALEGVMLEAIALAAEVPSTVVRRALQLSGNLAHTGQIAIASGESGLRDIGLELFRPIRPMLASTAESVAHAIEGFGLASVEWKLDGIRIQIHRRDEEVRIYTRNLNEITDALGGIADAIRQLPVREVVLDGEALWMNLHGPASFQETMSQIDSNAPPEG